MLTGVIFDVDGTLVDSVDLHATAWRDAFKRFGRDVAFEEVRRQIGKGADQLLPVFFTKEELAGFDDVLEQYLARAFQTAYLPRVRAFPRVRDLFRKIAGNGKRIALASSANKDEVAYYKNLARIDEFVTAETSADNVKRSKPHPDIFALALSKMGVRKDDVLVVAPDTRERVRNSIE
jgi:beta-phosphoglucomutase-like phosphatase (HAD superfamily)